MPREVLPLCCGSLCKYAAVALGRADAFVQSPPPITPPLEEWRREALMNPKTWDHASGVGLLLAAGGRVTDWEGAEVGPSIGASLARGERAFPLGGGGLIATSPRSRSPDTGRDEIDLHERLLQGAELVLAARRR